LSIFNTEPISHEGLNYWPVSMRTFFRLKALALPLFKALAVVMGDNANDTGSKQIRQDDTTVLEVSPIEPGLAKERHTQKQQALADLAQALFTEDSGYILVLIIMDCLREEFPDYKGTKKEAFKLLEKREFTAAFAVEALKGVAQANKGLLDPLGLGALLKSPRLRAALSSLTLSEPSGSVEEELEVLASQG